MKNDLYMTPIQVARQQLYATLAKWEGKSLQNSDDCVRFTEVAPDLYIHFLNNKKKITNNIYFKKFNKQNFSYFFIFDFYKKL